MQRDHRHALLLRNLATSIILFEGRKKQRLLKLKQVQPIVERLDYKRQTTKGNDDCKFVQIKEVVFDEMLGKLLEVLKIATKTVLEDTRIVKVGYRAEMLRNGSNPTSFKRYENFHPKLADAK